MDTRRKINDITKAQSLIEEAIELLKPHHVITTNLTKQLTVLDERLSEALLKQHKERIPGGEQAK